MKPILLLMLVAFQVQAAEVPPGKLTGEMEGVYQFYNGHSCSIAGIAGYENSAFV
jgi:hypothetical protein